MKIKELYNKFNDYPPDSTLMADSEIVGKIKHMPLKPLSGDFIIIDDDSGTLSAATVKNDTFNFLILNKDCKNKYFKFIGRLDKTEFENIVFVIKEVSIFEYNDN